MRFKSCVLCLRVQARFEVVHQWFVYRQTLFAENGERYNVLGGISNSVICTCILFDYEVNEKVMAPNQWVVRVM